MREFDREPQPFHVGRKIFRRTGDKPRRRYGLMQQFAAAIPDRQTKAQTWTSAEHGPLGRGRVPNVGEHMVVIEMPPTPG